MKRFALVLAVIFLTLNGFAQKQPKFTEEDAKQFYRTMQGDYTVIVNDSTTAMAHFAPIWEEKGSRFQWLYLETLMGKDVLIQKVIEVRPKTDKVFKVIVYDLKNPAEFVGKWDNRSYFDRFNAGMLKRGKKMTFVKTHDFSYQTQWARFKVIDCFPKGDLLHFKFVQEDERFYIKRMPKRTNRILGYQGIKELAE